MDYFNPPQPINKYLIRLAVVRYRRLPRRAVTVVENLLVVFPEQLIISAYVTEENMIITGRLSWKTLPELMIKLQINLYGGNFSYLASEVIRVQYRFGMLQSLDQGKSCPPPPRHATPLMPSIERRRLLSKIYGRK